jgi:(R,R)-butanediol dehydrogenase / meso-butanediol dehydrogenase / diacetyl reductase
MRAVRFHKPGDLRVEDIPRPGALAPDQVRIRVLAAGICGSDVHNFRTGMWLAQLPVTPGHEFSGEVVEVGADVVGFNAGDLVVADSRVPCGRCPHCLDVRSNLCVSLGFVGEVCDGGFAEEAVLPARGLLRVASDLAPEIAALCEPLAVALHAMRRLDPIPGEPVLVAGGGPIGGLAALLLSSFGFGPVLLAERNAARSALLVEVAGVEPITLDPGAIAARCGGIGPRFCLEATGSLDVLRVLLHAVSGGGRIAMVGIFHGEGMLDPNLIVEREIELRGCSVFGGEQAEALALLPALASKLARLTEEPIGLADVPAAYQRLIRGEASKLKTLIRP